jgi:hypothetical protein
MSISLDEQISEARKRAEAFSLTLEQARKEVIFVPLLYLFVYANVSFVYQYLILTMPIMI